VFTAAQPWLIYLRPRLLLVLLLGFSSGLPLALTGSTLTVWLTEAGISKAAVGLFAAIATPYTLKFLWSPLIDGVRIPLLHRLGRRRSWLLLTQAVLMASLVLLGMANPADSAWNTALFALLVATASATQDMVIDAYRVELLRPDEQAAGAAVSVLGYRLGMIAASFGALHMAAYGGWLFTYVVMAALVPVGFVASLFFAEKPVEITPRPPLSQWMKEYVFQPFAEFRTRAGWVVVLAFIVLYKLGDAFLGIMANPFILELGFDKQTLADVGKLYGVIATIIGGLLGGVLTTRFGILRMLWIGGILQAVSNLAYVWLAGQGADTASLALVITIDNVAGGIGTAAFVAYLSSLVNVHYTATQYALLSALSSLARSWLSTPAGLVAEWVGWEIFFILSAMLAIPGLLILVLLQRRTAAKN
jgi:MFS transporter, PAT family, beta-lactamase induction signal transducer AmpG